MARLQKESVSLMSFRLQEIHRLESQIAKDEQRWSDMFDTLLSGDLLDGSTEKDKLLRDWNNLNTIIEGSRIRLAQLKAPSDLTDEDRERLPAKDPYTMERNNIKY